MSNTVNINYMTRLYNNLLNTYGTKSSQSAAASFLDKMEEKSAEVTETGNMAAVSPKDMSLEEYKQYIFNEISNMQVSASQINASFSVHITDEGFEAMKNNPDYEKWVLDTLKYDFSFNDPWANMCGGRYSVHYFGASKEEYSGQSWCKGYQNGNGEKLFNHRSENSFWKKRAERMKKVREQYEEALEKKALQEKIYNSGNVFAERMAISVKVRNVKPAYDIYESENYRIVPDNEAGCFDIYNNQGERLGAFDYSDIKVRQDGATGRQLLISEHGSMSYDALVIDGELKEALQNVVGGSALETEELKGFTLKTHSGTGIQYLVRDGEEGRGGKVLLQSEEDRKRYEALAETCFNRYPNLVHDKNAGYIWADLEIKGLAQHTDNGIISMGFNGMSYNDNSNYKNNWSVLFSGDTYKEIFEWLQSSRGI